jgi:hypothetical protein
VLGGFFDLVITSKFGSLKKLSKIKEPPVQVLKFFEEPTSFSKDWPRNELVQGRFFDWFFFIAEDRGYLSKLVI